jgi:hypothetical protein
MIAVAVNFNLRRNRFCLMLHKADVHGKLQEHSNELSNLTDRPSKLDLVSRFDPDHMLSSTKTIEHKVVVGNYVRGGQHLVVPR